MASGRTTNQQLAYPVGSDRPDIAGDLLQIVTMIEKKLVQVFTSTADRDARQTAPTAGMLCAITGTGVIQFHNGTSWVQIYPTTGPAHTRGTSVPANSSGADGDVFFLI